MSIFDLSPCTMVVRDAKMAGKNYEYIYIFIEKYSEYKLILQIILQFSSLVRIILNIG